MKKKTSAAITLNSAGDFLLLNQQYRFNKSNFLLPASGHKKEYVTISVQKIFTPLNSKAA